MSEVKSWTVQISGTLVTLHGPKGLKLGHHVVLKSDFDTVVKERDDLRARVGELEKETDRLFSLSLGTINDDLHQLCKDLEKEGKEKDAEIQRLREALRFASEVNEMPAEDFEKLRLMKFKAFNVHHLDTVAIEARIALNPDSKGGGR